MSTASLSSQSMPRKIVATCPACQTRYKIKVSMSGRKAKCGKCQTRMRIPTLRAKLQQVVSRTSERARLTVSSATAVAQSSSQRVAASALASTKATGLGMLMSAWGTVVMLASLGAAVATFFNAPDFLAQYQNYFAGAIGGGALMAFIGLLTCGTAPSDSRSRFYILTAIFLALLNVAVNAYVIVSVYNGLELVVSQLAINITTISLSVLAFYFFMIFAAKIARYIGRTELSATARGIIWFQTLILAVTGGLVALANTEVTASNDALLQGIAIGILAAAAINQIILIVLQFQLGSALRKNG